MKWSKIFFKSYKPNIAVSWTSKSDVHMALLDYFTIVLELFNWRPDFSKLLKTLANSEGVWVFRNFLDILGSFVRFVGNIF